MNNDINDRKVWNSVSYICLNTTRDKILILKRAKNDDSEPGKWCVVGGSVESGETFEDSLFREVKEEIGCEVAEYDYFKSTVVGTNLRVAFFFGNIMDESKIKMNFEHSEFKWITFDQVRDVDFAWDQKKIILEFIDAVFGED